MNNDIKEYLKPGKLNIALIYIIYLVSIIAPTIMVVGAYFAYTNREKKDAFLRTHYVFAFRTFLICVASWLVCQAFAFTPISSIISYLVFILVVLRSIIAIQFLLENLPHPNPLTFWIK